MLKQQLRPRWLQTIPQPLTSTIPTLPSFLLPCLAFAQKPQTRPASILSSLSDTKGAYNKRIRRGRGPSSGKGKTSGRGHKGQKQHGKVPANFTGGQTPESVVHGHHGFKNIHAEEISAVNLDRIQDWIDQKRLDPSKPITVRELVNTRAIHGIKDGVKLLGRGAGNLNTPINIIVSRASTSAIAAVEAQGGSVVTRFYTRSAIRRILRGQTDPFVSMRWEPNKLQKPGVLPPDSAMAMASDPHERVKGMGFQYRLPDPTRRKDIEYYRDPAHRGYLAHTVGKGETPSLYHRVSGPLIKTTNAAAKKQEQVANQLW